MGKVDIKELFYNMQQEMIFNLKTLDAVTHSGTKGEATEDSWLDFFKTYLPKRYKSDKAIVIDHEGNTSDQIDIVVYDRQYCPMVFEHNSAKYIPAESVYAVFEVKQVLNSSHLTYASNKAKSVRNLKRTSADIYHAGGVQKGNPPKSIIAGILTTRCDWKDGMNSTSLYSNLKKNEESVIEIGCSLDAGTFTFENSKFQSSTKDESLIYFFIQFHEMLRKKGTVTALDILAYASALDSI
ncbi:DUF6602 domain-containing protein [Vagococcus carniphilus]|uniref:DUF6602 domain-containing protein n=2 Tax=Vagococcus carniphilus TaxID=218144 RepID=A0A430B6M8_9ENTE|nr:DUF6602 domain-containing protein [Vagococcus carniphilus]MDT2815255.1 hypothetical protein [Vagococcus carniphilus]QNN72846.1 hypothetical protein H9L18_13495 [Vagococcus carniphilus]RSU15953.1 hypothetical protein CBF28_05860 [Vagococcus carniphilus]